MRRNKNAANHGHDPYAALRVSNFRRLLTGRFLATLGDQMTTVAVGWQLYEQTHSTFALGLVGLVEVLPVIALSLPAGLLSDRVDRKRMTALTRTVLALCFLGMTMISYTHGAVSLLYGCLFAIGVARAFNNPAASSLLPQTVPVELLTNAVTWNSNGWQLAAAVGPALGGLVIALAHSATPVYAFSVASSLTFAVLVASIQGKQTPRDTPAPSMQSLGAGIQFLRQSPVLLATITLDLFAVLLGGATALLPVYAKDILHVGPVGLGWLRAAPSIGAVGMALLLAHLPPFRKAGKSLLWAVAGFGAATVVFGVSRSFWLSIVMLFLLGGLDQVSVVIRSSLLLLRAPDAMRGRVSAVNSIFVGASNELGAFESGSVAALIGPTLAVVSGGIGTILVVLATAFLFPQLRDLGALQEADADND